ncbi:MAG: Flp pilus assembly protein CpaB [Candidatus Omnitrophica bacterium]|nr:Flp pilus assembly protein CpaB [Candidatus Omnitrophota bacterium]
MQKRLALIIGVVLAVFAVILVNSYLTQQEHQAQERLKRQLHQWQKKQIPVLVAKKDIARGAAIESDSFEVNVIPEEYIQPQAVTSYDRISGMVASVLIAKGEQITLSKLITKAQAQGDSLAMTTPIGKRAITIAVDNISSLAGMIKPGDYVDVIVAVPVPVQTPDGKQAVQVATIPLFQNILVLAVGQELRAVKRQAARYDAAKEEKTVASLITLAVLPQEANLVSFASEQGKIRLVLRSPADSKIQPVQAASWETLLQYVMPQVPAPQPSSEEKELPKKQVEIYRGLKKEVVIIE